MSLRTALIARLCGITALVTALAVVWVTVDAYRTAGLEVSATLSRASGVLERTYMLGSGATKTNHAARTSINILSVMAPGTCVVFEEADVSLRRLCAGWQVFGEIPPAWFRKLLGGAFGPLPELTRKGTSPKSELYTLEASFDPVAAATRAWQRVRLALTQALFIGFGIAALGTGVILRSLRPVRQIVAALGRLADGDLGSRIEASGASEFRKIDRAVNDLARRLQEGAAQRLALTRKLLEVEDAERRQLARDLHDEFGQTLTATSAFAASIALAAADGRPDIVRDAGAIGRNIRSMMETLRGAFARLRPPDLDEIGLAASVSAMLAGWSRSSGGRTALSFTCGSALDGLPDTVALNLYRIVQECVTNAMRHSSPTNVQVHLSESAAGAPGYSLTVEDDGGGSVAAGGSPEGNGLLGIRERVAALGGTLSVTNTGRGVRLAVTVPVRIERIAA